MGSDDIGREPTQEERLSFLAAARSNGLYKLNGTTHVCYSRDEPEAEEKQDRISLMSDALGEILRFCYDHGPGYKFSHTRAFLRFSVITLAIRPDLFPSGTTLRDLATAAGVTEKTASHTLRTFSERVGLHMRMRSATFIEKMRKIRFDEAKRRTSKRNWK